MGLCARIKYFAQRTEEETGDAAAEDEEPHEPCRPLFAFGNDHELRDLARGEVIGDVLNLGRLGALFLLRRHGGGVRFNPQDLREAGCTSLFGSGSWPGDHLTGQRITEAPSEAEGIGWSSTFVTARSSNGQNLVEFLS